MNRRTIFRTTAAGVLGAALVITVACDHGKLDVPAAGKDEIQKPAAGPQGETGGAAAPMAAEQGGAATGGETISGTITMPAELAAKVPAGATLFIIARPAGMDKGPPLASLKLTADRFPLEFRIGPENVMMGGNAWTGQVSLSARLDQDGDAMTKGPGDIAGALAQPVAVGTQGVTLELNQPL